MKKEKYALKNIHAERERDTSDSKQKVKEKKIFDKILIICSKGTLGQMCRQLCVCGDKCIPPTKS